MALKAKLLILGLVFVLSYRYVQGDWRCRALRGSCQYTSQYCATKYVRGKCSGPWNRRCCLPKPLGSGSGHCSQSAQVSRSGWGAQAPRSRTRMRVPVRYVFIHHTAGRPCTSKSFCSETVRAIQRYHRNTKRWNDIGYNWLVGEDGRAYEGRGWTHVGGHTRGYNARAVAVSVMGNFNSATPNAKAIQAVRNIIACGVQRGYISRNYELFGHRDARAGYTDCPGNRLYATIRTWPRFSTRRIKKY